MLAQSSIDLTNSNSEESFQSYSQKFIQIFERIERISAYTKDITLQLIGLFHQNNKQFMDLFEKIFLQIYKEIQSKCQNFVLKIDKFQQMVESFIFELIQIELDKKKSPKTHKSILNWVHFFVQFFTSALYSRKNQIRQSAFKIISSFLAAIQQNLQIQFLISTRINLIQSSFYLLCGRSQEQKKMGIEFYALISKLKISSSQIEQLLFSYLEEHQNYETRRKIITQGITISQFNIDRFLNRLKDKNPLIVGQVIQKLINHKYPINKLSSQSINKLLVDGFGSVYQDVKIKIIQYFGDYLLACLELKNVPQQKLEQSTIIQGFQCFISTVFSSNLLSPFITPLIIQLLNSICYTILQVDLIKDLISLLFSSLFSSQNQKISSLANRNYSTSIVFLLVFIKMCTQKQQNQTSYHLYKFLVTFCRYPDSNAFIFVLKNVFNHFKTRKSSQDIVFCSYLIRLLEIMTLQLDLYDGFGRKIIFQGLKLILTSQIHFLQRTQNSNQNQTLDILTYQLFNTERLFNKSKTLNLHIKCSYDLISQIIFLMNSVYKSFVNEQDSSSDQDLIFKNLVDELFQNKQVNFEKETLKKMIQKSDADIFALKSCNQIQNPIICSKVQGLNQQIHKKYKSLQQKGYLNIYKGLVILVSLNSLKIKLKQQNLHPLFSINLSDYLAFIKIRFSQIQDQNRIYQSTQICKRPCVLLQLLLVNIVQNVKGEWKSYFQKILFSSRLTQSKQTQNITNKIFYMKMLVDFSILEYKSKESNSRENKITQQIEKQDHYQPKCIFQMLFKQLYKIEPLIKGSQVVNNINFLYGTTLELILKLFHGNIMHNQLNQHQKSQILAKLIWQITFVSHIHLQRIQYIFIMILNNWYKQIKQSQFIDKQHFQNLNNVIMNSLIIVIELLDKFYQFITQKDNINFNDFLSKMTNKIVSYFLIIKQYLNLNQRILFLCTLFNVFIDKKLTNHKNQQFIIIIVSNLQFNLIIQEFFQGKLINENQLDLQLLVLTKKYFKQFYNTFNFGHLTHQKSKYIQYCFNLVDEKTQQQIMRRFIQQDKSSIDQLSTEHQSPIIQKIDKVPKINLLQIQQCQKLIQNKSAQIQLVILNIENQLTKNKIFGRLVNRISKQYQKTAVLSQNKNLSQKISFLQNKAESNPLIESLNISKISKSFSELSILSNEILYKPTKPAENQANTKNLSNQIKQRTRNGYIKYNSYRNKQRIKNRQNQSQCFSIASVRKARFIVIPYDQIQKIQDHFNQTIKNKKSITKNKKTKHSSKKSHSKVNYPPQSKHSIMRYQLSNSSSFQLGQKISSKYLEEKDSSKNLEGQESSKCLEEKESSKQIEGQEPIKNVNLLQISYSVELENTNKSYE